MMESALARHLGMPESRRYSEYEDASILIHLAWLDWLIHGREAMAQRVARVALSYGADDLYGTIGEEKIFHMAGAQTPVGQTRGNLERAIREAGREAVQRNTFYDPVLK